MAELRTLRTAGPGPAETHRPEANREATAIAPWWLRGWPYVLLATLLLRSAMPEVHLQVFGESRVAEATMHEFTRGRSVRMSEGTQDALRAQIERRSIPLGYLIRGVASFCVLLIAALTLNGSLLFFGAEISAGGALAVTCIASLAETTLQVFSWGATVFVLGIDQAVAPDWLMTGAVNLSVLDPEGGAVWRTALAACDLHRVVGIAVATVAIRQLAPRTGVLSAIVASTVWTVCTLALRLLAATLLGIPVY